MRIPFFFRKGKPQKRDTVSVGFLLSDEAHDILSVSGYTTLDKNPEIMTGCYRIAQLIGSITIHLMSNTDNGDVRIVNELSRKIDIDPIYTMTRKTWMEAVIMNLLLYGNGNSVVWPHTWKGLIQSLEPIEASRVSLQAVGTRDYKIVIDGVAHNPQNMLHFVHNPDSHHLWKGQGLKTSLKDIATNLRQAAATEKSFMESKYKPSLIVKVDALTDEFAGASGRQKLMDEYLKSNNAGEPWIVPSEQFDIKEVRPLSLSDLAINDVVQLDKRAVASILGVPSFVLGVGSFNRDEWNNFVQNTVRVICAGIAQEMTRKLILNPKWYLKFNTLSLMDWDIATISNVYGSLSDRGIVTGNEVRDRLGMSPADGLDEHRVLENFIPYDMSGQQKKLIQEDEKDG